MSFTDRTSKRLYYLALQGRMRKLVAGLADALTDDEHDFISELVDANEPAIALEELSTALAAGEKALDEQTIAEIRSLVETMGLDPHVADQLEGRRWSG
jgi:hypothetical protein